MNRDPLYKKIEAGLQGTLDPELFERCAQSLVREVFPGLAPVRGGNDAGMDGAVADGDGLPFPLICTTSPPGSDNLRRSLDRYKAEGGTRTKSAFATSAKLTPDMRRKLEKEAGQRGTTLVQIFDRAWFADTLYRHPKWRLELLGITGDPPALSIFPPRPRPGHDGPVVGREDDLRWLRDVDGDAVLIGQPGSGKTFLHRTLAKAGECLFVVDSDLGRLADAIREQAPSAVVVDDAHLDPDFLHRLRHLRQETGSSFRIIANCWPSEVASVTTALAVPSARCRELDLLTREQILEVIHAAGLAGPDELLITILDQAEGRPGLAATLTRLCFEGDVQQVRSGEALDQSLRGSRVVSGEEERTVLAAFAVGGKAGMDAQVVGDLLRLDLPRLHAILGRLGTAGIVSDLGPGRRQVRPAALRSVLVRDIFFGPSGSFSIEPFLERAPSTKQRAHTLLGARQRGGAVPTRLLEELAISAKDGEVWEHFAWASRDTARLLIRGHAEHVIEAAPGLLHYAPEEALPPLIQAAGRSGRTSGMPEALQAIDKWIQQEPRSGATVERRRLALDALKTCVAGGLEEDVLTATLGVIFRPGFTHVRGQPGAGDRFCWTSGLIGEDVLRSVARLWPEAVELLSKASVRRLGDLQNTVWAWCFPRAGASGSVPPKGSSDLMRTTAQEMLANLAQLPTAGPAVRLWAKQTASDAGLDVVVDADPVFEAVFGAERLDADWEVAQRDRTAAIERLALSWEHRPTKEVADELVVLDRERPQGHTGRHVNGLDWLCRSLARQGVRAVELAGLLRDADARPYVVRPCVEVAVETRTPGWQDLLAGCLDDERYRRDAVVILLSLADPPSALLDKAIDSVAEVGEDLGFTLARSPTPETTLKRMLEHRDTGVRRAAVIGVWLRDPEHKVPSSLRSLWRQSAAACENPDDYYWGEFFRADPSLAEEWLLASLASPGCHLWGEAPAAAQAAGVLSSEQRARVMGAVESGNYDDELVARLMGTDVDLYRQLLADRRRSEIHLWPLRRHVDEHWVALAQAALAAGYSSGDIAKDCWPLSHGYSGPASNHWQGYVKAYQWLLKHPDARLHAAGRQGLEWAGQEYSRAVKQERDQAVYGLGR